MRAGFVATSRRLLKPFAISLGFLVAIAALDGCSNHGHPVPTTLFKTIRVPADAPTIQAAIDLADGGDTILVADGIYRGPGNRDIDLIHKILVILSENGPGTTIIDCGGSEDAQHGGFTYEQVGHNGSVLDGFTIRNAYRNEGAAILLYGSSPRISNCVLANNHATVSGGAIKVKGSSPPVSNCTIINNSCNSGAAIFGLAGSTPRFDNCIIAFNDSSDVMVANEATTNFTLSCCDVFGNSHGDFVGDIESMQDAAGNFSSDPLVCEPGFDYHLETRSPCTADLSPCGQLVGALDIGCPSPPK